jgi:hypothetical protein
MILPIKILDLPPMPRNRSHMLTAKGGRPMNIKTPLAREYEKDLAFRLKEYAGKMMLFRNAYIPTKHYVSIEYYIYTPKDVLFTKDGHISARCVDLDAHKVMQDVLFDCLGLNDKLVRNANYFSPQSHDGNWNYVFVLKLENLCNLTNTSSSIQSIASRMNETNESFALL